MMYEIDIEIGIFFQDEIAIGRALVVERIIRHRSEGRLEAGKPFERGLRPRIFFTVEREAAVLAMDRYQAFVEMTALDGGCRTFLALEPELIDILPRDAFERCDRIRADTL